MRGSVQPTRNRRRPGRASSLGEPPPSPTRLLLLVCAALAASVWRVAAAMSEFSQIEERSMMFDMMAGSADFGTNIGASSQGQPPWRVNG